MHAVSRRMLAVLAGFLLGSVCASVSAQGLAPVAGEVEYARGAGTAQAEGQAPRALGKGLALKEGDRLTTAADSTAIVRLQDGTRMTLRPNSELIVQKFEFKQETPQTNSLVMQLLRGGLRAVTGLISKGSPDAAKLRTSTATIGIRGTDFDARLCGADCRTEAAAINEKARPNAITASAKLSNSQGEFYAVDGHSARHRLVDGGSVYPGDTVESTVGSQGVLVFRDDSRVTLGGGTQMRIDAFTYDQKSPGDGKFLVSLLRGSLRALTGLIGKVNHRNVGFATPTATIGVRGTGLDLDCSTTASCNFFTWLGSIEVTQHGQSALQVLQAGQGLYVDARSIRPIAAPTLNHLRRPDTVHVNVQQLFNVPASPESTTPDKPATPDKAGPPAAPDSKANDDGLYVYVRDGHIEIASGSQTLHLGRGETGFANGAGEMVRPVNMPLFIQFDPTPMPNSNNPRLTNLLQSAGVGTKNVCR